jgi:hypothetical protein
MVWLKRFAVVSIVALFTAVLSAGAGATTAPNTSEAAYKSAHDSDPHLPLTTYQQDQLAAKIQDASDALGLGSRSSAAASASTLGTAATTASTATTASSSAESDLPFSVVLLGNQTTQAKSYWCGPAAVHEALDQLGINVSQATLAAKMGTTTNGTAWSGSQSATGHPVADALNDYQMKTYGFYFPYYVPIDVPVSPSATDVGFYKLALVTDIWGYFAPLIGDAWETPYSAYRLRGHPNDRTIFHWFDIRGYTNYGANTMYEDSVHGASPSMISWAASVPAYSTQASAEIVHIVGGRGYVW